MRVTIRVLRAEEHFGCRAGDVLVCELGGSVIRRVHRPTGASHTEVHHLPPNWGYLAGCISDGTMDVITPGVAAVHLAQAIGSDLGSIPPQPPGPLPPPPPLPRRLSLLR